MIPPNAIAPASTDSLNPANNTKKRIAWVDTARGLAILMVIYSHLELSNSAIMRLFTPCFLGVFFFISGYLHKSGKPFLSFLEQRTRTLFLPFVFWGSILLAMRQVLSFHETVAPFCPSIVTMLFQYGEGHGFIWFIPALYAYSICFYWIERVFRPPAMLLAVSGVLFLANWVLVFPLALQPLPYTLHFAGFGCAYMGFGRVFRQLDWKYPPRMEGPLLLAMATAYVALSSWCPRVGWTGRGNLIVSLPTIAMGLFLVIRGSQLLSENALLTFIGSNSLLYFCLHGKAFSFLEFILHKGVPASWLSNPVIAVPLGVGLVFATALLLIIPIMLINRFAPWTTGKGFHLWPTR